MCVCGFPFARRQINHSGHNISVVHREKWGNKQQQNKNKRFFIVCPWIPPATHKHNTHPRPRNWFLRYTSYPAPPSPALWYNIGKKKKINKSLWNKSSVLVFVLSFFLYLWRVSPFCCCSCYSIPERDPPLGSFPWKIAITGFAIGIRILYWKENNEKKVEAFLLFRFPFFFFFWYSFINIRPVDIAASMISYGMEPSGDVM